MQKTGERIFLKEDIKMKRRKEKVIYVLLGVTLLILVGLFFHQKMKYEEMVKQYEQKITEINEKNTETLSKFNQDVIQLKEELREKEKVLEGKEIEVEGFQIDYSQMDTYIVSKFHPDGRIYNINIANVAFYPNSDLTGRLSEAFEFISDVSDPLEREDGTTVFAYLTTKGVVYSNERVSLYEKN